MSIRENEVKVSFNCPKSSFPTANISLGIVMFENGNGIVEKSETNVTAKPAHCSRCLECGVATKHGSSISYENDDCIAFKILCVRKVPADTFQNAAKQAIRILIEESPSKV
jgi:hypothetical protein